MSRVLSTLAIAALLAGAGGDRLAQRGPASAAASPRPARAAAPAPGLPPFALFGWLSPPSESTSAARMRELAGAGLGVALSAWGDSGRAADNLRRIRFAADCGVRCLVWDERFDRVYNHGADPALLDTIVADYANEPGFLGYSFTDEPQPAEFPLLARIYSDLRQRDPGHPAWDNLLGMSSFPDLAAWESYVRAFVDAVHPRVLCVDLYDFLAGRDQGLFVRNVAALRGLADEYSLPFWFIVQLVQHGPYRALTVGELRWQVSHLLAYGARGAGYFTYWTPAPDPEWNWQPAVIGYDGRRTAWYDVLASFNPRVRAAGETLAALTWLSTQHAGSVPGGGAAFVPDDWIRDVDGRAALGRFAGGAGGRYLLVANSDSLAARTVTLSLPRTRRILRLGDASGSWSEVGTGRELGGVRARVALDSGGFALLQLEADPGAAPGPVLAVGPNPARGAVRFAVSRIGAGARLEIVDSGGRRVWSRALEPGAALATWSGEREGGGRVRPGIYLARVSDAGGVTTARVSWLGAR
ncbi:MAG TPA: T9SS type A sorting domain-containing protein [Candidatus Eisenbacteria bacterium]|jgi:hypothetical protein